MKVTVDTNFLISATQWDYSVAHKLLKKFILSDAEIFTTQDILDETAEVLERDFGYNKEEVKNIIEKILLFVKLIEPKQKVDIIKDDPDDNKVIECAVESSSLLSPFQHFIIKCFCLFPIKLVRVAKTSRFYKIFIFVIY